GRHFVTATASLRLSRQGDGAAVMAGGGCQGNPAMIMAYRKPRDDQPPLPQWKQDLKHHRSPRPCARRTHHRAREVMDDPARVGAVEVSIEALRRSRLRLTMSLARQPRPAWIKAYRDNTATSKGSS